MLFQRCASHRTMHMSYRSKIYTRNDVIHVNRSMIRVFLCQTTYIQSTFNVLDITSKLFPTSMSQNVHPKPTQMPYTELVDMFMACLHTKSYMSSYNSSPATASKQKEKKSFAHPSHYCTFYQNLISTNVTYFFRGMLEYLDPTGLNSTALGISL